MPGTQAAQNLQMPHPRDWQGGQMPRSSPGGLVAAGFDWCINNSERHTPHHGFPPFLFGGVIFSYYFLQWATTTIYDQELQWDAAVLQWEAAVLPRQPILQTPPNPWCACALQAIIFLTLLTLVILWYCLWTLVTNLSQSHHRTWITHWAGQLQETFGLNAINQGMMLRSTRQVYWFTFY